MVFGDNLLDPAQFLRREAPATFQADGIKPNLCFAVVTFHMNMRRFTAVASVEEQAVRSTPQDCGHRSIAETNCSSMSMVQNTIPVGQRTRISRRPAPSPGTPALNSKTVRGKSNKGWYSVGKAPDDGFPSGVSNRGNSRQNQADGHKDEIQARWPRVIQVFDPKNQRAYPNQYWASQPGFLTGSRGRRVGVQFRCRC